MGYYTEIFFRAEVDREAYQKMREAVKWGQWDKSWLFRVMTGSSAYFPNVENRPRFWFERNDSGTDEIYAVEFRASIKNYDNDIERFFTWVAPHCVNAHGGFIGYSLGEDHRSPRLFYADGTTLDPREIS